MMRWPEKTLVIVLRASAAILLVAVVPAVMPFAWMTTIHRELGLGQLPETPIVGYLTRSISALYATHGALVLFVSLNVRRYLPVVKCLGVLNMAFGAAMLAIDCSVGMPLWWIACEGPPLVVLGAGLLWLAARADRQTAPADG